MFTRGGRGSRGGGMASRGVSTAPVGDDPDLHPTQPAAKTEVAQNGAQAPNNEKPNTENDDDWDAQPNDAVIKNNNVAPKPTGPIFSRGGAFSARGGRGGSSTTVPSGVTAASQPVAGDNDDWDATPNVPAKNGTTEQPNTGGRFVTAATAQDNDGRFPPVRGGFAGRGRGAGSTAASAEPSPAQPGSAQDDWQDNSFKTQTTATVFQGNRGRGRGAFGSTAPPSRAAAEPASNDFGDDNNISGADSGDQSFASTRGRSALRGGGRSSLGGGGAGTGANADSGFGFNSNHGADFGGFGGGVGGGGSGGKGCYNCNHEGHMSKDCPNPKSFTCYNCGQEGHSSKECQAPRKPAEGQNCYNCGESGHISRDCTQERKPRTTEGQNCYNCGESGHISRDCAQERKPRNMEGQNCFTCQQPGHISRDCPDRPPREGPEDDPSYVPPVRLIDEIFDDDKAVAEDYKTCADEDDEIVVVGCGENKIQKIETWAEAKFEPALMENISRSQYVKPRPIQQHTIPVVMDEQDVKGHAETGSGKSAAFLLPIINWILKRKQAGEVTSRAGAPFALILEPTRELCLQLYDQARKFAHLTDVKVAKAYGKYSVRDNIQEINSGCDVLIATTGRAKDFIGKKRIIFDNLRFFVLDEADRLLDENFMIDVREIVAHGGFPAKDNRQTLLFSATFPDHVQLFSEEILREDHVMISRKDGKMVSTARRVKQTIVEVPQAEKKDELKKLLEKELEEVREKTPEGQVRRTLVFVRTKRDADTVASFLTGHDLSASTINGDRPQKEREEALLKFRQDRVRIIVATDVMARGLDIQGLDHVINMDLPNEYATYVHRVGRTGRIHKGFATSFFDPCDGNDQKLANNLVEELQSSEQPVPDFLAAAARGEMPANATGINDDDWGGGSGGGGGSRQPPPAARNDFEW